MMQENNRDFVKLITYLNGLSFMCLERLLVWHIEILGRPAWGPKLCFKLESVDARHACASKELRVAKHKGTKQLYRWSGNGGGR
jgi:hypothetical protein